MVLHAGPVEYWDGWPYLDVHTTSLCNQPPIVSSTWLSSVGSRNEYQWLFRPLLAKSSAFCMTVGPVTRTASHWKTLAAKWAIRPADIGLVLAWFGLATQNTAKRDKLPRNRPCSMQFFFLLQIYYQNIILGHSFGPPKNIDMMSSNIKMWTKCDCSKVFCVLYIALWLLLWCRTSRVFTSVSEF